MSTSSTPLDAEKEKQRVAEKLRRYPATAVDDYWTFRNTGDEAAAHRLILAVLVEFSPKRGQSTEGWIDSHRLIEDIGFDSLALAETVFFFEELFEITISNEEIMQVRTLGELRVFVRSKVQLPKA